MIFTLTPAILQGGYPSTARLDYLRQAGITHILNVCDAGPEFQPEDGPFAEIAWHSLADDRLLTDAEALTTLDTLHRIVCQPESKVYVHCIAGWFRSPTVVWLYLLACGASEKEAARQISQRNPKAAPGHVEMVNQRLVELVRAHGQANYLPHPRAEALVFA